LAELNASLLIWTTTPWTLVSNTAVAVNPKVEYQVIEITNEDKTERLVVASDLASVLGEDRKVIATFKGTDLEHTKYQQPFELVEIENAHFVVLADYVTTEDGTGLVHQAPAFGADDLEVCRRYGLVVVNPINPDGHFQNQIGLVGGKFFKDADKDLIKDLKSRGLMFKNSQFEHSYPHCWRCHTALMYYAQPSWYVKTTAIKQELLRENSKTDWHPETIKTGRFGDWLNNNIDWAVSRNRYWGTPLPIWRCENNHEVCIGSLSELSKLSGTELNKLDPHRPFVDDVKFKCTECSAIMSRVSEVIDCWYDSGAMPFAQWGYPHKEGSVDQFNSAYPADFICEAIDQTRGWFYTLMAIGTLVFDKSSYKTVLCLGHILDKDGRKMSKHLGNVLEPIPLMDQHGADAVRWYMLAAGSPWSARRVGHDAITDVVRKTLLTYWNTISFFTLYANASNFVVSKLSGDLTLMDRWIISELNKLTRDVDFALENFDSQTAGSAIASFIDDLSNWYVRRSRRRFWDGDESALNTLYFCLKNLTLLLAPMVPFISEHVWQTLIRVAESDQPESVHLSNFPNSSAELIDDALSASVSLSRRLVELGRAARAESGVKIRQPLSRALVSAPGWELISDEIRTHISEELNILQLDGIHVAGKDLVDVSVKANFRTLGTKYGADVQAISKQISSTDAVEMVKQLRVSNNYDIAVDISGSSKIFTIEIDDLVITETPRTGWSVSSHNGESLALDLELTPELLRLGLIREAIRAIQEERKNIGLDVSDRIIVTWSAPKELADAINSAQNEISAEVLATKMNQTADEKPVSNELGLKLKLEKSI
uniref:isoleucine--tRNA ligase n=1 Tax=Candidatus Nanopelagicus sp. TaxID=2518620 RepID=UPI00404AB37B